MDEIVLVSGGFDPVHSGHIKLIEDASNHGKVVVLLNSDKYPFGGYQETEFNS